jgi:hypothetical protein
VLDAATYFPLIPADDLVELGHWLMQTRPGCDRCRCAGGYRPASTALHGFSGI